MQTEGMNINLTPAGRQAFGIALPCGPVPTGCETVGGDTDGIRALNVKQTNPRKQDP
jgi:hypothetical protein